MRPDIDGDAAGMHIKELGERIASSERRPTLDGCGEMVAMTMRPRWIEHEDAQGPIQMLIVQDLTGRQAVAARMRRRGKSGPYAVTYTLGAGLRMGRGISQKLGLRKNAGPSGQDEQRVKDETVAALAQMVLDEALRRWTQPPQGE